MPGYYASGEFHPEDSGGTSLPGSAVFFHGVMYYFNRGSDGTVFVASCTDANGDVQNGWSNMPLPEDAIGAEVVTDVPPAAVVCGDAIYLFWYDTDAIDVRVARATWDPSQEASLAWSRWSGIDRAKDAAGPLEARSGPDFPPRPLSACALGDGRIVLAFLGTVTSSANVPWFFSLETANFVPGQTWTYRYGGNSGLGPYEALLDASAGTLQFELDRPMSLTWYSAGGDVDPSDDASDNTLVLACAVTVDGAEKFVVFALQASGESYPLLLLGKGLNKAFVLADAVDGVSVVRDPGGRVRAYYQILPSSPHLITALFDTSGELPTLGAGAMLDGFWAASSTLPVSTFSYSDPM